MGKQLEQFVKKVVEDVLKQSYTHLVTPAVLLARVSSVKELTDTYEVEKLDIHNDGGGGSYRGRIVGRWQEYTLTVVDRFGNEDSSFPPLPNVRSRIPLQAGVLAAIALPFGDLTPVIIGEVVL